MPSLIPALRRLLKRAAIGLLAAAVGGCADAARVGVGGQLAAPSDVTAPAANEAPPTRAAPATLASVEAPPTQITDPAWPDIAKALERTGVAHEAIYTFTIPRDDLDVAIDGMAIPTGAGIESVFHFYRCPCGKMNVAGQFVVTDYEMNDVVDALRKNAVMTIASVGPLLLYERPRLLVVRFQGEGDAAAMAAVLREALRWTGKERLAPEPTTKAN